MKRTRIKRKIVSWQTKDQGANPLTERGKKWIAKEIKKLDEKKLRKQLESQPTDENDNTNAYWNYLSAKGWSDVDGNLREPTQANPDSLSDEDIA